MTKNTTKHHLELCFFEDAGHGWLQVPKNILENLNIANNITPYSYMHRDYVYLEQDLDMTTFMNAIKQSDHYTVGLTRRYHDRSPVRNFLSYCC